MYINHFSVKDRFIIRTDGALNNGANYFLVYLIKICVRVQRSVDEGRPHTNKKVTCVHQLTFKGLPVDIRR